MIKENFTLYDTINPDIFINIANIDIHYIPDKIDNNDIASDR